MYVLLVMSATKDYHIMSMIPYTLSRLNNIRFLFFFLVDKEYIYQDTNFPVS